MHLLYELVSFCRREETKEFRIDLERSDVDWKVEFLKALKPSQKSLKKWRDFIA